MGGTPANRITSAGSSINGLSLGQSGGAQNVQLSATQSGLPAHTHSITDPTHTHTAVGELNARGVGSFTGWGIAAGATSGSAGVAAAATGITGTNTVAAAAAAAAHLNVQPGAILNFFIKY